MLSVYPKLTCIYLTYFQANRQNVKTAIEEKVEKTPLKVEPPNDEDALEIIDKAREKTEEDGLFWFLSFFSEYCEFFSFYRRYIRSLERAGNGSSDSR